MRGPKGSAGPDSNRGVRRARTRCYIARMDDRDHAPTTLAGSPSPYEPPAFEVIALDCEITAYAPADDRPLF